MLPPATPKVTTPSGGDEYYVHRARFLLAVGSYGVHITRAEYDDMTLGEINAWRAELDKLHEQEKRA